MSENDAKVWLVSNQHNRDAKNLRKIVKVYKDWMDELADGSTEWPRLRDGPWSVGTNLWRNVFMTIEGTDEQVRHLALKFYQLVDLNVVRCFRCMADDPRKLDICIDKYNLE